MAPDGPLRVSPHKSTWHAPCHHAPLCQARRISHHAQLHEGSPPGYASPSRWSLVRLHPLPNATAGCPPCSWPRRIDFIDFILINTIDSQKIHRQLARNNKKKKPIMDTYTGASDGWVNRRQESVWDGAGAAASPMSPVTTCVASPVSLMSMSGVL